MSDDRTGTAFLTDPVQYRSALVDMVRRRLFGPTDSQEGWITQASTRVVYDGWSTSSTELPLGPFTNPTGDEVLVVSPRSVYVTGVLWGNHVPARPDDEPDDESEPAPKVQHSADGRTGAAEYVDDDDDSLPDDIDGLGRRRSLAVSFRSADPTAPIDVDLGFGTYRPITCRFGEKDHRLWERQPHRLSIVVPDLEEGSRDLPSGDHQLRVGWRRRRDAADGSSLVTVWVSNETGQAAVADEVQGALFQVEVAVTTGALLPYAADRRMTDPIDLLYRNEVDLAIGHGTDVTVEVAEQSTVIRTAAIPVAHVAAMTPDITDEDGVSLAVSMADLAEFNVNAVAAVDRLIGCYAAWIGERERELVGFDGQAFEYAAANVAQCRQFLDDVVAGWVLARSDSEVRACLADASRAMQLQRIGSTAPRRKVELVDDRIVVRGVNPHLLEPAPSSWRPFQIAFVLASLPKVVDPEHPRRSNVDVIWMPTGGGKTEAYLGLAAFTILWERRQITLAGEPAEKSMMSVLMRYTLRLLTVQQFLRSAALVCALERIREAAPERYGTGEVRIGTWVGSSTTPNKRDAAVKRLKDAALKSEEVGFLLTQCPWCGSEMGQPLNGTVVGYRTVELPGKRVKRVMATCPDPTCDYTYRQIRMRDRVLDRGLPVLEVDEDVYAFPPDFVIGTIDKVAMMWDQTDAQRLFGIKNGSRVAKTRPPALFIQDELHLITGPLGSLNGVIEAMLEELCTADGGRAPLLVASTATTRNYAGQIGSLYARSAQLVPPPALDIEDSFFSVVDHQRPPRVHVGVCSSGGFTASSVQLAVLATLAHFPPVLEDRMISGANLSVDPYWTNVCFFSSRAALGSLTSLCESKMRSQLFATRRASGARSGSMTEEGRRTERWVAPPREITATSSENVSAVLADLAIPAGEKGAIDLCFATSMIEVGLDVQRLGLMTVIGQPKASSQYIQVTGRVGRSLDAPALVVAVLGTRTPRDRSHYEHFGSFHRRLYASVEGASVTPFTEQALERSVPTVAAILCQVLGTGADIPQRVDSYWDRLTELLVDRASRCSGAAGVANVKRELARLRTAVGFNKVAGYDWVDRAQPEQGFLFAFGAPVPAERPPDYWWVLTSTRSVDPDAVGMLHTPGVEARQPKSAATGVDDDDEELM